MATCRVYEKPAGGLALLWIVEAGRRAGETDAAAFARIVASYDGVRATAGLAPVAGQPYVEIDEAALPAQRGERLREFRDAWRRENGGVVVDMPAARVLRVATLRAERDRRFVALDKEFTKAQGQGDAARVATIDAKRQALRDVPRVATAALENLDTPEALAAYEPEWPE